MHDTFERSVRESPHDLEMRLEHADWLEENGLADRASYLRVLVELTILLERGAGREALEDCSLRLSSLARLIDPAFAAVAALGSERWGAALAFAPVRLEVDAEPVTGRHRWQFEPQLRRVVLVMGDFTGRADARPLDDRRELSVAGDTFAKRLRESKLRFAIDVEGQSVAFAVDHMSDFDADAVAARLTAAYALSGSDLERAVRAVFGHRPFLQAERAWRSLWLLLQHTPRDVHVAFVNCSKDDLIEDFDDAPEIVKSGLSKCVNQYNHHGMRPNALLVLDYEIDPASATDRRLLGALGEVGRRSVLPIVAGLVPSAVGAVPPPEDGAYARWRNTPEAAYVALCAPSFELRRSPHGALHGAASFLAACLAAQSLSRHLCGCPLLGAIPAIELAEPVDVDLARDRGYLAYAPAEAGASLRVDTTCVGDGDAARRSLSATFLVTRMCHQLLDIDHRAGLERDVERLTARFNERLAARFAGVEGVRATTSEVEWTSECRLRATLSVTVPSPVSPHGTTVRATILLRMSR